MSLPHPGPGKSAQPACDGEDVPVTHRDGRTETVRVRLIPREELYSYGKLLGDRDGELAECACYVAGKDASWAASLTEESVDHLLDAGEKLNLERFGKWFRRHQARFVALTESPDYSAKGRAFMEGKRTFSRGDKN